MAHPGVGKGEGPQTGVWGESPSVWRLRGSGGVAPAANKFLRFSHKKTLILAHFFIEKGHGVSAVTMDNAKTFLQLMSKSRSLAKIRERRLQPFVV